MTSPIHMVETQKPPTEADPRLTETGLLYNIFGDKILRLNFIPQVIYNMQSAFYRTVVRKYGVTLDTRA